VGQGLLILDVSRSHTTTHHSRQDSSGRVISSSQRPLPDNTQQSQQTDIHAPGGIRTHNLSRRAAADLRLRWRGHWDRRLINVNRDICLFLIEFPPPRCCINSHPLRQTTLLFQHVRYGCQCLAFLLSPYSKWYAKGHLLHHSKHSHSALQTLMG